MSGIFAEESAITPLAQDTISPHPGKKEIKKFFVEFVWANNAFEFSSSSYSTVYNDGIDEYALDIPEIEIKRNNQFGLSLGWLPVQNRIIEEALQIGFQFITGEKSYGVQFQLTARHAFVLFQRFRLHLDLGASYNRVNMVVGSVGRGSRSGADFMYGPDGEYIPRGSEIFLYSGFFAAQAGGGFQIDIIPRLYLDISSKYVFYCNSNKWILMASGEKDNVKLRDENFTGSNRLGSIENTGPGVRICVGFRF